MNESHAKKDFSVEEITEQLVQHVQSRNMSDFYKLVKELHPYDLSLVYKKFPEEETNRFLLLMSLFIYFGIATRFLDALM
ncbi:hypothetical protein [Paenibacillus sp.]